MPLIRLTVHDDGTMSATVNGEPLTPPFGEGVWRRSSFAQIVDQVTADRMIPARVEVTEADGSVFTDIITPSRRRRTEPDPEPASEEPARRPAAELVALHGEGFVPGEDVAIAVVIAHGDAAPDGTMRGLVEAHQLAGTPTREVILLGRVSGTLTIGHPE